MRGCPSTLLRCTRHVCAPGPPRRLIPVSPQVASVSEDADGATVTFDAAACRAPARADFVAACDGVNSALRLQIMGAERGAKVLFHFSATGYVSRLPPRSPSESAAVKALRAIADGDLIHAYATPTSSCASLLVAPFDEDRVVANFIVRDDGAATRAAVEAAGVKTLKGAPPKQQKPS